MCHVPEPFETREITGEIPEFWGSAGPEVDTRAGRPFGNEIFR